MEGNPEQNENLPRDFLKLLVQNSNRLLAATLINELAKRNVTKYYLSPGHRNAPLMAAIHHHPLTKMESVIDERSAGYRALGYAASTETCPALVCTSGTALANYYPSLIEAWASDLPILVISADRPRQQIVAGENQTIIQPNIYGRFAPSWDMSEYWQDSLSTLPDRLEYFLETRHPRHINISFEEPLGSEQAPIDAKMQEEAYTLLQSYPTPSSSPTDVTESANVKKFNEVVHRSRSPLIVVGEIKSLSERQALFPLLKESPLPFYLDVTSGIKYQFHLQDGAIPGFEHPEVAEYLQNQIDTVIHIGGRVTSRNYYRFLQDNVHIKVLNVSSSPHQRDPSRRITQFLRHPPASVFPTLLHRPSLKKWDTSWMEEKIQRVSQAPLSFPQISKILIETIPEGAPLFLGNSTTIRSFDNYISFSLRKDIPVYYNRGVSGIEGHIASALGIAEGTGKITTAIIGDVSFLHDMGSLSSLSSDRHNLIIILVNDGGGGIFNLLPTSAEKDILPYMTTPHSLQFEATAKQFKLPYCTASNGEELVRTYQFLLERGCGLLEVKLDPKNNLKVYRQLKTLRGPHVLP